MKALQRYNAWSLHAICWTSEPVQYQRAENFYPLKQEIPYNEHSGMHKTGP